jgi:hypothetical protein
MIGIARQPHANAPKSLRRRGAADRRHRWNFGAPRPTSRFSIEPSSAATVTPNTAAAAREMFIAKTSARAKSRSHQAVDFADCGSRVNEHPLVVC